MGGAMREHVDESRFRRDDFTHKKERKKYSSSIISSSEANAGKKVPTSVTTPIACAVPRSMSFVTVAGSMSTQIVFTYEGSMFPTAMECNIVAIISTRSCLLY